jgi:hypothetical protein
MSTRRASTMYRQTRRDRRNPTDTDTLNAGQATTVSPVASLVGAVGALGDAIRHRAARYALALSFVALSILGPYAVSPVHSQSAGDPLVLAFYYTWFDESSWTYDQLSDLPAQPYASRDRAVMARHIEQAQAAGIDAFLVAWYGPGESNQTETNLAALLEEAAARNFRIGVLFETDSPFFGGVGDVTAALQHLNAVHATHSAYLRADGRPVVFFWRPSIFGVDTWRTVREQADPGRTNIWVSEGVDTGYLQVFDGHHLYSNTWNPPADLAAVNAKFAGLVASTGQELGAPKLWVATVMPGYNDTRIRQSGFARDRAGGTYFTQSWQAAIDSRPNWIVINSFNEWPEGTYIEPSTAYGDQYLGLSAAWSSTFKGTSGPVVDAAAFAAPPPAPTPTSIPQPNIPTAMVDVALLNVRAGPGTEFEQIGQVPLGTMLPITGSASEAPDWWQVAYARDANTSEPAWLYAPLVTALGPLEQVVQIIDVPSSSESLLEGEETTPLLPDPSVRPLTPYLSP